MIDGIKVIPLWPVVDESGRIMHTCTFGANDVGRSRCPTLADSPRRFDDVRLRIRPC